MKAAAKTPPRTGSSALNIALLVVGGIAVLGVIVWQALTAHGVPDPNAKHLSRAAMALSSGVLVFREGLEAILVLAAVTAGVVRNKHGYWRSVIVGVVAALAATVLTWFIAIALISSVNARELDIQAATGLLAIVVLLVVMNWFFHKIYWTGWICSHCKRRNKLLNAPNRAVFGVSLGLALLGFTAIYREGFEVVLFLQDLRMKAGSGIVLGGAGIGLLLTGIVAGLTFALHQRLPYKKMLVLTGVLLAGVLVVMIGESVQEMQQAGWIATTQMSVSIPDWMGTWFATFPNAQGIGGQLLAVLLVAGSYAWVRSRVPAKQNVVTAADAPCLEEVKANG